MQSEASFRFPHAVARRPAGTIIRGLRAVDKGTPDPALAQQRCAAKGAGID